MSVSYEPIDNLPFYSLKEFKKISNLSSHNSPVFLYKHRDTEEILAVKEVPYREES